MSEHQWEYPIAVLAHGGGYASVVEQDGEETKQSLIVVTDPDQAPELMQQLEIMGAPRLINNAREFRWLLQSVQAPVTNVAFDLRPEGNEPHPTWTVSIDELLRDQLVADYSPWNYPIYTIAVDDGYLSITGQRADDSPLHAIAVFRFKERAENYIEASGDGELHQIDDLGAAVQFFQAMSDTVDAVALDPLIEDGQCRTERCFAIDTLLSKYLIEDGGDGAASGGEV